MTGNAQAGENIDLDAGGDATAATLTRAIGLCRCRKSAAGRHPAGLEGQSSDAEADYNVGILAGTTIETGNIEAFESAGLGALGDIATGDIDVGNIFLALGGANMSFGAINSGGPTYLANSSMIPLGGDLTEEGGFDPEPILATTPVASGGSIAIGGDVNAGRFEARGRDHANGRKLNATGPALRNQSGDNMSLGDLFSDNDVKLDPRVPTSSRTHRCQRRCCIGRDGVDLDPGRLRLR